jgi:ribosomal protein S18 acetylase RimI-like enzyme
MSREGIAATLPVVAIPDSFLSEMLGSSVFRIQYDESGQSITQILNRQTAPALFYYKVLIDQVQIIHQLEYSGFRLVDVALIFSQEPAIRCNNPFLADTYPSVREARSADRSAITQIASTAFRYSRFHNDPLIADDQANELKQRWVGNFFDHLRGDTLLVAEVDGSIEGFLLVIETEEEHIIDLIAVAPWAQQRGHGRSLIHHFLARASSAGKRTRVGTQAVNTPSVRLYEKTGFRLLRSEAVFHLHLK